MSATSVILVVLFSIFAFKIYQKFTTSWCRSPRCLVGKTVIVTGATSGVGLETALDFAKRGARVILACKDCEKGAETNRLIREETGNEDIFVKFIDLGSFESVRKFAKDINESEKKLNILVNNAAVTYTNREKSKDGYYLSMQVNYFSLFLLTNLLLELLQKTGNSRIVNVSSFLAKAAFRLDFNYICTNSGDIDMYCRSKLYSILFTKELARRIKNTGVTTYSVDPGTVQIPLQTKKMWLFYYCLKNCFLKTPEEGAQSIIYCSIEDNIEMYSGRHFKDCKPVDDYRVVQVSGLQETLWDMTEKLLYLQNDENLNIQTKFGKTIANCDKEH